ncbi:MAG: cation:proton antiporter [Euzebya sp.]
MTTAIGLAVLVVGYGLVSRRLAGSVLTGPILFTAFGLLAGRAGLGLVDLSMDSETTMVLAEATLVLVLFTDAARIDLPRLRRDAGLPLRMLASLPLTIGLGTVAAFLLLPRLDLFAAAVLAAVLAPTDAALGQVVVTDPRLPVRIRQTLNVESGLNDGIVLPFVTIFLGLAGAREGVESVNEALSFVAAQVGFGLGCGVVIGCVGAWLIDTASARGWMTGGFQRLATLSVAALTYLVAQALGGNGFIAAFVGGMAFGVLANRRCQGVFEFAEEEGSLLTLLVFTLLGASLAPELLQTLDVATGIYVVLSLTVIRMLPIALSLLGTGLRWQSIAFLGWFGPRGLATILFGLLVVEGMELPTGDRILSTALWTVLASILLHGMSAVPLVGRYTSWLQRGSTAESAMSEMGPAAEFPTRVSSNGG